MLDKSFRNYKKPERIPHKRTAFDVPYYWHRITRKLRRPGVKKKIIKYGAIAIASFLVLMVGTFAYFAKDLPSPDRINARNVAQSTKIYDRTGEVLLYEVHGEVKRTVVTLDKISDDLKYATISAEDQNFYKHFGFDPMGIMRAIFLNVATGETPGGSTITQQFVKNSILTPEKTYTRKLKELILSMEIEFKFTKDEILQMYLNEIPYGSNAYGAEAAAQTFFAKSASELTLAESAALAALPQAPTYYSPHGSHLENLKARQEWVLDRMVVNKYITAEEAETAKAEELAFEELKGGIIAPHFVMYVLEQLETKYGEDVLQQGGLQVYTTLNMDLQRIAERVVPEGVERNKRYNAGNAALVALDPKTGDILAMQGSKDYWDRENDGNVNVALADRQPGSSFKPFAYAKAFEKGYTPDTILYDLITDFGGGYIPKNYNLSESGPITMRSSLANSKNITAVKTLYLAGVQQTIDLARKMGITTLEDADRYGLSLVLGGGEVKLLDEAAAFSVFANDGVKHNKKSILKVLNFDGKTLEDNTESKGEQVLEAQVARQINSVLSDNVARAPTFGTNSSLYLGTRPAAVKTGTTQEYRDGWTVGYTPNLVAGIWAGNNDNTKMASGAAGLYVAAPIWNAFMKDALSYYEVENFINPGPTGATKAVLNGKNAEETKVKLCKPSMKLATDACPEHLIEEKTYQQVHNILFYVNKDNPRGPYPTNPQSDPQFTRWEGPVIAWAEGQNILREDPPTETDDLHNPDKQPSISIATPNEGINVSDPAMVVKVKTNAVLGVAKVEYFIDTTKFGESSTAPYSTTLNLASVTNGIHKLTAKIVDIADNVGETNISINLKLDNPPIINLITPLSGTKIGKADFPYDLSCEASASAGIKNVKFYYSTGGSSTLIKTVTPSNGSSYHTNWAFPGVGVYSIFAVATDNKDRSTNSGKVTVTVE